MGCGEGFSCIRVARGVDAVSVAEPGGDPGFVQGDPELHRIAQGLVDDTGVLCEAFASISHGPAPSVFESLGQVPVIQSQRRLDRAFPQPVYQPPIIVEPLLVRGARTLRLYAGPGNGEPVSLYSEPRHKVQVFFEPVGTGRRLYRRYPREALSQGCE